MKICLTFICRDNEDVIEQMLDSCLSIIDGVVICDTGSKDGTKNMTRKFCDENKLSYGLYTDKWENFGHNRTLMMQYAQKACSINQWDYILVMDTDEILQIDEKFNKEKIFGDIGLIKTISGGMEYWRDRLFSAKHNWKWIGYAHEYPHSDTFQTKQQIGELSLHLSPKINNDHIQRNCDLLEKEKSDGKATPRTYFYLGQSYRDLGKLTDAIKNYEKCKKETNWGEEKFFATYDIAKIQHRLKDFNNAEKSYLEAWELSNGVRAEPLYHLAILYREKQKHHSASIYLKTLQDLKQPPDGLFLEWSIYKYLSTFEHSINLYWLGKYEESWKQSQLVKILSPDPATEKQNRKNMTFAERKMIEDQGWKERLVIQLPDYYDGLGDHLLFSHLPELAKKAGFKKVYISNANVYKTEGTKSVVWDTNKYVDGFTDDYGPFYTDEKINNLLRGVPFIKDMPTMKQIAIVYGVYNDNYNGLPILYMGIRKSVFDPIKRNLNDVGLILFDGNWKHHSGITQKDVDDYFKTNKEIYTNDKNKIAYMKSLNDKALKFPIDIFPEAKEMPEMGLMEYIGHVNSARRFICVMSGSAVVSAALMRECIVIDNENTNKQFKFPQINLYLLKQK